MTRQNSPNYAGLRTALVLGSVAASVIGGRLVTARDAAKYAAQNQDPSPTDQPTDASTPVPPTPMPTPTPKVIIVYDLPPLPTAITLGGGQPAVVAQQPGQTQLVPLPPVAPPPPVNTGGGGGGSKKSSGGGGGKKSKSS